MDKNLDQPLLISASRTKDMVHRSPDLLANILQGKAECRWGPYGPFDYINPSHIHTIVLWTKDPGNLLNHVHLRETLIKLQKEYHIQISLQMTVTGFGGSFIEYGLPVWIEALSGLKVLCTDGLLNPAAVVFRYDPFLVIRTPGGNLISNMDIRIFKRICTEVVEVGIPRIVTSRADAVHYPKIVERVRSSGLEWVDIDDESAFSFCDEMEKFCRSKGVDFSVCCDPPAGSIFNKWGCIDARWLNRIKGDEFNSATEILHNKIGKQRPTCQCTYSRDIGYSTGSATCYSGGYGCLYCYSQGNAKPPDINKILKEIQEFDQNPSGYLSSRDLPPELYRSGQADSF